MNPVNPTPQAPIADQPGLQDRSALVSALVDGEVSGSDLSRLLKDDPESIRSDWKTYHLIGEVLRQQAPVATTALSLDFSSRVMQSVLGESSLKPVATAQPVVRTPAANDAVFRWKLVAGVASMAAVAAVGWSLVSSPTPATGSQLALAGSQVVSSAPPSTPSVAPAAPETVVVQTPQGQMVRDARLEQLLSEHRQFGGVSALQMPAGFLRNATYDVSPQR